jgi:AcrR family transcriptional regulator
VTTIGEPANARSRRTRAALLSAARALLETDGFEALTMTAVAERAGVTRRSVYLHFPSRADLVGALFDHVAQHEQLDVSLAAVWAAPDARGALEEWARHVARYHPRLIAVDRAVERVHRSDPDAAAHRARVHAEKLAHCKRLASRVARDGRLAHPWTSRSAADAIFAITTTDLVAALIIERRWSRTRFAAHLGLILTATFLADDAPPTE